MQDMIDTFAQYALPHWPFIAIALVLMLVGEVAKHYLWTKERAKRGGVWKVGRQTMPLHPVLTGIVLGALWKNPTEGVDTLPESMGYFALAGVVSTFLYDIITSLARKRGIDIDLFDTIPPLPPKSGEEPDRSSEVAASAADERGGEGES